MPGLKESKTIDDEIAQLTKDCEKIQLEQKIIEAKKKIAEAEDALNPSEMETAKTLAEQEQAIAEAQKTTLKTKLPDFDVETPKGEIKAESVNIESHIMAYQALSEIVSHISEEIKKEHTETKAVVICDGNDLNNYFSFRIFKNQVELLKTQYKEILSIKMVGKEELATVKSAIPFDPLIGVSTVLSSFVSFASLFRTDVDIKGVDIGVVEEGLIAELVSSLQKNQIKPIYLPFRTNVPGDFLNKLSDLRNCREKADNKIAEWKDDEEQLDHVESLKCLNKRYDQIETALLTVDEKTGSSRLDKMVKGEILNLELEPEGTDILYLKVVKMGGNNKTKRSFLRNEIAHSGGAIMAYFLMDKEGGIKESKTLYCLSGYHRFDISEDKNSKVGKFRYDTNFNK